MKCLRCEKEMSVEQNNQVEVDICMDGCGGIWFDPFEMKQMNERSEISKEFLDLLFKTKNQYVDKKPRLNCPKCKSKMLRHFHSVYKEVEVDQCGQCYGHWLDGGELLKIIGQFRSDEEKLKATAEFFNKFEK